MLARNFAVAVVLQLAATTAAWALPIADFTSSATEDDISIYSPSFSFVSQKDGSASNAGAAVSAADNRSDQFGTRVGTAAASLASGQLKAASSVSNITYPGTSESTGVGAFAMFGDTFIHQTSTGPFAWTSSDIASFQITISGLVNQSGGGNVLSNNGFLSLIILKPGTLGSVIGSFNQSYSLIVGATLASNILFDFEYGLTPTSTYVSDYRNPNSVRSPDQILNLSSPQTVNADFAPGGDFDWILMLDTYSLVQSGDPSQFASVDLSHTVGLQYFAPEGVPRILPRGSSREPSLPAPYLNRVSCGY